VVLVFTLRALPHQNVVELRERPQQLATLNGRARHVLALTLR
jgi:hypothetical protein